MPSPPQTLANMERLCAINSLHQSVEWLRYAVHSTNERGDACWSVKQDTSRIELHLRANEALLLLWIDDEAPPPMDNILPHCDASAMVQEILAKNSLFPQALAWARDIQVSPWSSIWLATQWWPLEGITDAVDNPGRWLHWWWTEMMEFTTEPPPLYDTAYAPP